MSRRFSWATAIVLCLAASPLWAQTQDESWPRPNDLRPSDPSAGPDQPVNPQLPTIERRAAPDPARQYSPQAQPGNQVQAFPLIQRQGPAQQAQQNQAQPPQPPPPPFTLTPQEEVQLDLVLKTWEDKSKNVNTFDCSFVRWEYDPIFVKPNAVPNAPASKDYGILKYAAPDKGVFRVMYKDGPDGKQTPVEDDRADHWICDGKSIFQYIPKQKKLLEQKLPPEMQGKAIVNGPLPFLFGADAQKLRQRYWLHTITPPEIKNQIWLEAYPRFQTDAANYQRAIVILSTPDMLPQGLQIFQPNGKSRTSYSFYDIVLNDPLRLFHGNPFQAYTPRGWQKIVEDAPAKQAGRPGGAAR